MSKNRLIETEYGRDFEPKPVAPATMRIIDILFGRLMKNPIINRQVILTSIPELAQRCRVPSEDISRLFNQGKIVVRTPFGPLKPVVTNSQVSFTNKEIYE